MEIMPVTTKDTIYLTPVNQMLNKSNHKGNGKFMSNIS